ncbi:MAG TPA: hypothetical protein VHM20_00435, partial [Gammaproteobacteria bacterium]|nr:hypothetical protein [Gammaproteobacteria bacterium]
MASRAFTIHHKKQVFRIICGLFFAAIMQYFFAYPGFYWLPLATLIVMLTKRGNALYQGLLHFFVLIIIVSVLTLIFNDQSILYQRAQDIILGALIGILTNLLIFPDRVDIEFREIIMPILDLYGEYFQNISECILERNFVPAE